MQDQEMYQAKGKEMSQGKILWIGGGRPTPQQIALVGGTGDYGFNSVWFIESANNQFGYVNFTVPSSNLDDARMIYTRLIQSGLEEIFETRKIVGGI